MSLMILDFVYSESMKRRKLENAQDNKTNPTFESSHILT